MLQTELVQELTRIVEVVLPAALENSKGVLFLEMATDIRNYILHVFLAWTEAEARLLYAGHRGAPCNPPSGG